MSDADKLNHTQIIVQHSGILATLESDIKHMKEQQNVLFDLLSKMDAKIDTMNESLIKQQTERNTIISCATLAGGLLGGWISNWFGGK